MEKRAFEMIMLQTIFKKLEEVLKKDERLASDDGRLLKNKAVELANKLDERLVKILFENAELKDIFFKKIGDLTLFDKDLFIEFLSNKEFLPDSYTAFKNKVGLATGRDYLKQDKEVTLIWPYKDCVLEGGQTKEEAKRGEIFWNTTLAPEEINRLLEPKVLTNWKRYDKDNPKKGRKADEIHDTDNLIIKGNNLLALHSLKKRFGGRVNLIYIDPPYNTGNDSFKYNDSFNHSTWLTFMKNRLSVARELLHDTGSIFVQIDTNECAYLKVLMDEIFSRENFRNQITWLRSSSGKTVSKNLSEDIDYILWYSKSSNYNFKKVFKPLSGGTKAMYNKDDSDGRGVYRLYPLQKTGGPGPETTYDYVDNSGKVWKCPKKGWRMNKNKLKELENDGRLYCEGNSLSEKAYWNERENEGQVANNLWHDIPNLQGSNKEKIDFTGQKPEALLKRIVEMSTDEGDIVLDYQAGTGTTGAVAHKMNRQYILIEQMDYIHDLPEARLKAVIEGDQSGISKAVGWKGGGSFVYAELMPLNEKFVREIEAAKSEKEVSKIWKAIQESGFVSYRVDPKKFDATAKEFADLDLEKQKKFILESLDANMLYVNYSDIGDKEYGVGDDDKKLNDKFYGNAT